MISYRPGSFNRAFYATACVLMLWTGSLHSAKAQIIIGNLANRTSDTAGSTIGVGLSNGKLVAFTMGSTSMTLGDIQLQLAIPGGISGANIPQIEIYQGTSSTNSAATGVSLITLTNPTKANDGSTTTATSETYTFSAPSGFLLQAGLTYDIVVHENPASKAAMVWEIGTPQTGSGIGATQNSVALFGTGGTGSPVGWTSTSSNINWYQVDVSAVPEPSTWAMLGFGLFALAGFKSRNLKKLLS